MHQMILASQSPRRRELLQEAGYIFRSDPIKVSEIIDKSLNATQVAQSLAHKKGRTYLRKTKLMKGQGFLVVSADTVVSLENHILGKPKNMTEAQSFLRQLSGVTHRVITAICVQDVDQGIEVLATEESRVTFKKLSDEEIRTYVDSGEPFDKAGGYGIQGLARVFVEKLEGSYSNVVGFPLELFAQWEKKYGWKIRR